jgi:hypothetical protein
MLRLAFQGFVLQPEMIFPTIAGFWAHRMSKDAREENAEETVLGFDQITVSQNQGAGAKLVKEA